MFDPERAAKVSSAPRPQGRLVYLGGDSFPPTLAYTEEQLLVEQVVDRLAAEYGRAYVPWRSLDASRGRRLDLYREGFFVRTFLVETEDALRAELSARRWALPGVDPSNIWVTVPENAIDRIRGVLHSEGSPAQIAGYRREGRKIMLTWPSVRMVR